MSDMSEQAREWGSGSYTAHVYAVEARSTHGEIILKADPRGNALLSLVLTPHEWKRIPVEYAPVGVPNHLELYPEALHQRFLTYACAMALACWLQASRDFGGIETRLVAVEFTSSFSTRELGASEPLNLFEEDRRLFWRLKKEPVAPPADRQE